MPSTQGRYISGGYYLSRLEKRSQHMSQNLLPDQILSASGCICDFFPDDWTMEWSGDSFDIRMEKANRFGISQADLPDVMAWATDSFSKAFGWPRVFYTLKAARQALTEQLSAATDVVVFGLGLHESNVEMFLREAKPPGRMPGFAAVGQTGIFECVNFGKPIEVGKPIGFEPLAMEAGLLTCSWLCNGLEKDCAELLDIQPNGSGLIGDLDQALRCVEYISRDDVGAEPGLWLPWLLTMYSFPE